MSVHRKQGSVRKILLCMSLLSVGYAAMAQQRPQYTQYMFSGLVINPAYAGVDGPLSATLLDRRQWTGIEGAPKTQTLALHTLNKKKRVGLGLLIVNDKIGIHQNLTAAGDYAYHIPVGRQSFLSMGLQAGIFHVRSDYGSLVNAGNPDPKLNNYMINRVFFDMGAGIYFRSPRFHMGISAPELLPKNNIVNDTTSVSFKSVNLFTFLKYRMSLGRSWEAEPALLIKHFNNVPLSAEGTLTFIYKDVLTGGVAYRIQESIGYLIKLRATPQLQFGYAYDNPIGATSQLSSGSHEFMIQLLLQQKRAGIKSPRI